MVRECDEPMREVPGASPVPPPGGVDGAGAGARVVWVAFKGRRVEPFDNPGLLSFAPGDRVLVEVERGSDLGTVLDPPGDEDAWLERRREHRRYRVLRAASGAEAGLVEELRAEERASLAIVKDRVEHFGLPMHLVDAELQFDRNRVTFFFTADHRVDFRELVRDLAGIFRTRIELRQIGTREAARRLGGIGPCGRELCCGAFLWDFERVTLQMAREQNLTINPSRLSGICGRLLCCLAYEDSGRACDAGTVVHVLEIEARGAEDGHAEAHLPTA